MVFVVENAVHPQGNTSSATYEQPLNERMRTFLRLEFLHQQTEHHSDESSDIASRQAINGNVGMITPLLRRSTGCSKSAPS